MRKLILGLFVCLLVIHFLALKAQCSLLEEENREMRALLLKGAGKKTSEDGVENLQAYIKELEQDSDSAILHQVTHLSASLTPFS